MKDKRLIGVEKLTEYVAKNVINGEDICLIGSLGLAALIETGKYTTADGTNKVISEEARNLYKDYILNGIGGSGERKVGDIDLCFIQKEGMTQDDVEKKHMTWEGVKDFEMGWFSNYEHIDRNPKLADLPEEAKLILKKSNPEDKLSIDIKNPVESRDLVKIKIGESVLFVPRLELFLSHKVFCSLVFSDYQREKLFTDYNIIFDVLKSDNCDFKEVIDITYRMFDKSGYEKLDKRLEQLLESYNKNKPNNNVQKCPPNELINILRALVEKDIKTKPEEKRMFDSKEVREKLLGGRPVFKEFHENRDTRNYGGINNILKRLCKRFKLDDILTRKIL